jgi:ethanolamine utilization protein EutA
VISFGIDIGTTTLRAACVEIHPGPFGAKTHKVAGPTLCIYTPYLPDKSLDQEVILKALQNWATGQPAATPDLGTLLFTGEAQRASNCKEVASRITNFWKGLISAQLNPEIETLLAAHGSGAVELSGARLGRPVLNLDIGGGTTNLAWIENGQITDHACLNLGARKWIFHPATLKIEHRTHEAILLESLFPNILKGAKHFNTEAAFQFADLLASLILEPSENSKKFLVIPWRTLKTDSQKPILFFSGGIVDCMNRPHEDPSIYGDLGPWLAKAILQKTSDAEVHRSHQEGQATALGVSSFGFSLSGNSIHFTDIESTTNVPLLREAEFPSSISQSSSTIAIHLNPLSQEREELERAARSWACKIEILKVKPTAIIFLLTQNLAKSFGYFLKQNLKETGIQILVLDEFSPAATFESSLIRTVDIRKTVSSNRFAITVKAINLY